MSEVQFRHGTWAVLVISPIAVYSAQVQLQQAALQNRTHARTLDYLLVFCAAAVLHHPLLPECAQVGRETGSRANHQSGLSLMIGCVYNSLETPTDVVLSAYYRQTMYWLLSRCEVYLCKNDQKCFSTTLPTLSLNGEVEPMTTKTVSRNHKDCDL